MALILQASNVIDALRLFLELFSTHRQCTIEITNNSSSYSLCSPRVFSFSGRDVEPLPPKVDPSKSGSALFTKTAYTARGAVGVFTYDLHNTDTDECSEQIAVMFSVPFDYFLYSNCYAVGIFSKDVKCDDALFRHMYYSIGNMMVRGKAGTSLICKGDHVTVLASMSNSSQPIMKVEVEDNQKPKLCKKKKC